MFEFCTQRGDIYLAQMLSGTVDRSQPSFCETYLAFFPFFLHFYLLPLCIELHLLLVLSQRGDSYDAETLITESSHSLLEPHVVLSQGPVSAIRLDWDNGGCSEWQPRQTTAEKAILQANLFNLAHYDWTPGSGKVQEYAFIYQPSENKQRNKYWLGKSSLV